MPFFIAPLISAGAYFGLDFISAKYKEQQEKEQRRKILLVVAVILGILIFIKAKK